MNITNIELLQSSVEFLGTLYCIMVAIYLMINRMTHKVKYLLVIFISCAVLFFSDAVVFVCQNNTDPVSMHLTTLGDTILFLTNCVILAAFVQYCRNEIKTLGISISKKIVYVIDFICLVSVFIIFVNIFNGWMFWFDADNIYHRNWGWYIYTGIMGVGVLVAMYVTLKNIRLLPINIWLGLLAYEAIPFVSIVLQFFLPELSVSNMGIAIAATLLLLLHLKRISNEQKARGLSGDREISLFGNICLLSIIVVFMGGSIIASLFSVQKISAERTEYECRNTCYEVNAEIEKSLYYVSSLEDSQEISLLKSKLSEYEEIYGIEIYLVNSKGFVELSTDSSKNQSEIVEGLKSYGITEGQCIYDDNGGSKRVYFSSGHYPWYLVIDFVNNRSFSILPIIAPCLTVFLLGFIVMGLAYAWIGRQEARSKQRLLERTVISLTDELTGLLNRRAYEEELDRIGEEGVKENTVVAVLDVNGLKLVNDTAGHEAGDELLVSAAECMKECLLKYGKIYRTGGDEFVALLNCDRYETDEAISRFKLLTGLWKGERVNSFDVSVGYIFAADYPDKTIREIQTLADKRMYEDKKAYYKKKESVQ